MGNLVQNSLERKDYEVLDKVEVSSKTERFLFGIVTIVDSSKWRVLGLPLFVEEKQPQSGFFSSFFTRNTDERTLYKLLAKSPDADIMLPWKTTIETWGIPLIWDIEKITYSAKGIRIKTNKELEK